MKIPVSVVIVTKQEEKAIATCLDALTAFDEVVVVDSASRDKTTEIAKEKGVRVIDFQWNGQYPKKRQWVLDNVPLRHDWVFFVDADEMVTKELTNEIRKIFARGMPEVAGYFITGRYFIRGKNSIAGRLLNFGLPNRKLALLNKTRMTFPAVDDLDIPGMGEIEGHYQPVARDENVISIGMLKSHLVHHALDDEHAWAFRHQKYARWEAGMNIKGAWPDDPVPWRQKVKACLRFTKYRPWIVFFVTFFLFLGFLDGRRGWDFALRRFRYYSLIKQKQNELTGKKS